MTQFDRRQLRNALQNQGASFETHDVTGFLRIRQGRRNNDYSNDVANLQRRVNVELFRLNKAQGLSSAAAAADTGYSEATLRNWERFFYGTCAESFHNAVVRSAQALRQHGVKS
jgi:hypothetical protein